MTTRLSQKRVLVGFPPKVYGDIKKIAGIKCKTVSGLIRDCVIEKLETDYEDSFTKEEIKIIKQGIEEAKHSKGVSLKGLRKDV
ncbi:hypothetical protein KKC59_02980 [bacterium]|nr:hypothetical protein [bacterium]